MANFTYNEINLLKMNGCVETITETTIRFTKDFKNRLINETNTARDVKILLTSIGICPNIIGKYRIKKLVRNYSKRKGDSMGKVLSTHEKDILIQNPNVRKITSSKVIYTADFMIQVAKCDSLTDARKIFENNNLDPEIIGSKRIDNSYYRWKEIYKNKGENGLINTKLGRKKKLDSIDNMTLEEQVKFLAQRNKELEEELEFAKKLDPSLPLDQINSKCIYALVYYLRSNGGEINITKIFKKYPGTASGYYRYVNSLSKINPLKEAIIADIKFVQGNTFKLGYRRMYMKLKRFYKKNNINRNINDKMIRKLMRENNLGALIRRKNPNRKIWKATQEDRISENKLNREFKVGEPREILLTDITYLHCKFGTAYLSAIKDSVTNEIVSYTVKDNMKINLSIDVINQLDIMDLPPNVYIHSDQGVHYTAKAFRALLQEKNIGQSMSRRGNCWDNAPMESFFGHFKDELDYEHIDSLAKLKEMVDEYMIYYNHERDQWGLKKMTPIEYRRHLESSNISS